ncbi:unnamed protein product [Brassica oleracea var. botrytis]
MEEAALQFEIYWSLYKMIVAFTPVVHFVFVSGMTTLSTKVCVGGDEKEKEATLKKIHLVS